jgi:hypothetical protein
MEKCRFCGAETELYQNGIPICTKCADDYERLVESTPKKNLEPPSDPEDLKQSG